ncbi:probable serine/threonine-protein kinase PBL28 [Rutidosis leptorrhynchoides]|uniref:probable serine/threonine-protein kinase PBL28 n=1 Tax=Rutidosis leptorrhynchoides TaxID=125765 RepID=UPI003A994625
MDPFMKEFEHLIIELENIKLATSNFDQTQVIGSGGFGKVYKAEVPHHRGISVAAVKRLDRKLGQGDPEFWKEVMMLSRYSHKNLISLYGFCNEDGERILVYEYASNGSLDHHLSSTTLGWSRRIKICLDAARGLSYLHDDNGAHQRVLHRDIKSANILLDDEWNAKVADLGLSKVGPANQQHTALVTGVVGTIGYLDPVYWQLGLLTKESDVYSFGVVLMEVLTGKLCYQKNSNGTFSTLVQKWKKICKTGRADEIVFRDVMQPLAPDSLKIFSGIAFKCLNKNRENRPLMYHVVKELEAALELQEPHDLKQPKEYEEIKYKSIEVSKEHQWQNGGKTYSGINIQQGSLTSYYKCFTLGEIKMATKGFSDLLGQGAIGKVFCGEISGSRYDGLVAVKRWNESSNHRQDEFQKEIEMLSACNHPNIISLFGCCDEGSEKILVQDFMKNGSLYDYLHMSDRELTPRLTVEQRLEICLGVAKGLSYLHYGCQNYIIHSDIQTINIFLDADLVPKISNFRFSKTRAAGTSSSNVVTNTIEGFPDKKIAPSIVQSSKRLLYMSAIFL